MRSDRRRFLVLAGSTLTATLAGCSGGGGGDGDDGGDDGADDGENGGDDDGTGDGGNGDEGTTTEPAEATTSEAGGEATTTDAASGGPNVQVPDGDATISLSLGGGGPDFDSLVVDLEKIVFVGAEDTDDVTVQVGDTGLDMTELPDGGKTYLDASGFPSGDYTTANVYITVQSSTLSEGGSATFEVSSPVAIDLVLFDDPLDIPSGSSKDITLSLTASSPMGSDEYQFDTGFSSVG